MSIMWGLDSVTWKRNVAKNCRNSGQQYTTYLRGIIQAKIHVKPNVKKM